METEIKAPHMGTVEREAYRVGHSEIYRGFEIKPKRDFGAYGYYVAQYRTCINAGWIICYTAETSDKYAGCNAIPGASFAWTLKQAKEMIDDLIKAGGEDNAHIFWNLRAGSRLNTP